jgi:hypothetical protein
VFYGSTVTLVLAILSGWVHDLLTGVQNLVTSCSVRQKNV